MEFSKTTLSNGLRVIMAPQPSMQSATVQIMVRVGSRDETNKTSGIAHFLEHLVFKGTKNYPTAQDISSSIDAVGGEINANTGKERTAYYIKAWERYLPLSFDILSGFVKNPLLDKTEMEKEKGVILEEIAMYDDLPMQKAPDIFENLLYSESSLGRDILGARETIKNMKHKEVKNFIRSSYIPSNMVLSIAGRFDTDQVLELSQKYFGELGGEGNLANSSNLPNLASFNPSQKPELRILNRKSEQVHIVLGVRANYQGHPDRYKESVMNAILGGGMSSRMWSEVREKRALVYYVKTYFDRYMDCGYFATRAGVKSKRVEEAIKVILEQYQNITLKSGNLAITEKEVSKAKEHIKGSLALDLEDTHSVSEFLGNQELFERKIRTIEEIMSNIDLVTSDEISEMALGFFQNSKLNLAIVGPVKDENKLQELLKF